MRFIWVASILTGALLGGCMVDGQTGYVGYAAPQATVVAQPGLVEIQPGVQVVQADYDYPVFYSDNLYWRYDGGVWYSSRWHDRGWATSYSVPARVRGIDRPYGYAHYRGGYSGGYSGRAYGNGGYRGGARVNGTGRTYTAPASRSYSPPARSAPTTKHR